MSLRSKKGSQTEELVLVYDGMERLREALVGLRADHGWQIGERALKKKIGAMTEAELRQAAWEELKVAFAHRLRRGPELLTAFARDDLGNLAGYVKMADAARDLSSEFHKRQEHGREQQVYNQTALEIIRASKRAKKD